MIRFVKPDADGQIIEQGYCQPENLPAGAIEVADGVSALTHYIANGVPVAFAPEVAERRRRTPTDPWMRWSVATGNWVDPRQQAARLETQWKRVREDRDARLRASDWVGLSDSPVTGPQRAQWVRYRQDLRDVTQQTDPFAITWPVPPA